MHTLHQFSRPTRQWNSDFIVQIQAVWQPGDAIILLGEAANGLDNIQLQGYAPVYILQTDADILGISTDVAALSDVSIITYEQWACLILSCQKQITWA